MTLQLEGQLDLFDLLRDETPGNAPDYVCVCRARIQCDAAIHDLVAFQEKHRAHGDEFAAAQWPGGRENHPDGKHYGPLLTIDGENLAATLTTKAPHAVNYGMRYACPSCLTNWGELRPDVQERIRDEHDEVEPGICRAMADAPDQADHVWAHALGRPTPWAVHPRANAPSEESTADGIYGD